MALTNYRDLSIVGTDSRAGFQFEFSCSRCSSTWKSPLKPYRRGRIAALMYSFAFYVRDHGGMSRASSTLSGMGAEKAKASALAEAQELAEERFAVCPSCHKTVCESCWDSGAGRCEDCLNPSGRGGRRAESSRDDGGGESRVAGGGGATVAQRCPNCGAEHMGGRFCAECGFDLAATHKGCPNCGATCPRSARFCTDCGHGF